MKKVVTWVAEDETEFDTEEECWAYEHRYDGVMDAAVFLDDEFNVIEQDFEQIYKYFQYIAVKDAEKAKELFQALKDYEWCFVIPEGYAEGTILSWDGDDECYIDLQKRKQETDEQIAKVVKAVWLS